MGPMKAIFAIILALSMALAYHYERARFNETDKAIYKWASTTDTANGFTPPAHHRACYVTAVAD